MPAGEVTVRLNLNKDGYSAGMTAARKEAQQLEQVIEATGHKTVTSMQAASASIRFLENGMNGSIRAAERFLGTIPGISTALEKAFPVVGAAAVVGIFIKIGEEAYKATEKVREMNTQLAIGFDKIASSGRMANDTLALSNVRLQNEIDKLEHKPANRVAEALAEAKVQADQLYDSLRRDNEEIAKVLDANQSGILAQLMGKAPSKDVGQSIKDQMTQLQSIQHQVTDSSDPEESKKLSAKLEDRMRNAVVWIEQMKKSNPNGTVGGVDFSGNFAALDAAESIIKQRFDNIQLQKQHTSLTAQKEGLQDGKNGQADLLKRDEEEEKRQNAFNKLTINEEIRFWNDRIAAFTKGGEQYIQVQDKIYDLISKRPSLTKENDKNQAAAGKFQVESGDLMNAGAEALKKLDLEQTERMAKAQQKLNELVNHGNEEQERAATAFAETSLSIALAQGNISRLEAAQAMAAIHANDHAAAIKRVNDALTEQISLINSDPKLTGGDKAAAIRTATQSAANQTSEINGVYRRTQAKDNADVSGNTISGAITKSLDEMVQSFTDMASSLKTVIPQTIEGLNGDIAKLATGQGQKGDFGRTFKQAGEGLVKTGLQGIEGEALKFFTHGKLGGKHDGSSQEAALWVMIAKGQAAVSGMSTSNPAVSAGVGMAGLIPGGSFIQPFLGAALHMIPGFAGGGDPPVNRTSLIGEHGPELFVPRSAGTIIPNHQLGRGGDVHIHVDARGATDPAAVHAAVMRAQPHTVALGIQAQHSMSKRRPLGR